MEGKSRVRSGRTYRKRRHKLERRRERPKYSINSEKMILLRKWMKKENFKCILEPAIFSATGRGLMAKQLISPGDTIITLSVSLLITTRTVLNTDIASFIKRWNPKLSPQQAIAVFLIWENQKSVQSPWLHYISVLPDSFSTPGYLSSIELSLLPRTVKVKAQAQCEQLRQAYEQIDIFCRYEWPQFYRILTFDNFRWAWYVINTRSIYMRSERSEFLSDEDDNIALAPFLDLLNHSSRANIDASYNDRTHCYEITTHDRYKRYDQVFISYGPHDNQKLFLEYGFTVPNNAHDVHEFTFEDIELLHKQDKIPHWDKKLEVLRENKLLESLCCSMEGLSWKLLTVLRTFAMNWDQLKNWVQIFQKEEVPTAITTQAKSLAKRLITTALQDNQESIQQFNKVPEKLENGDLIYTLLNIEENILTHSLKTVS